MEYNKIFELFEEKTQELLCSRFTKNLKDSGLNINWQKGSNIKHKRRGPDYEAIKNFVVTFRNFILDSDLISIRNIAKIYNILPNSSNDLIYRFKDARIKFNDYLDSSASFMINHEKITNRKLIDTYIYGDVIHLEKNDKFKKWISMAPMKDFIFNEIVVILSNCLNFICYFNNLNKEYLLKVSNN